MVKRSALTSKVLELGEIATSCKVVSGCLLCSVVVVVVVVVKLCGRSSSSFLSLVRGRCSLCSAFGGDLLSRRAHVAIYSII